MLAAVVATPALSAGHTISAGVVVYDSAAFGGDDILDGATAVLQIGAGSVSLSNAITLDNGGTLDNAGGISRNGPGVWAGVGTVSNHDGGTIESVDDGIYFDYGGTVTNCAGSQITGTTGVYNYGDPSVVSTPPPISTRSTSVDLSAGSTSSVPPKRPRRSILPAGPTLRSLACRCRATA